MLGSSGQHAAVYTLLHISGPIIYYSAVSTSLLSAEPATATHNAGGVQQSSARTHHRKNPEYWEHQTATGVSHNHPAQGWLTLGSPISQTMTFFHVVYYVPSLLQSCWLFLVCANWEQHNLFVFMSISQLGAMFGRPSNIPTLGYQNNINYPWENSQ